MIGARFEGTAGLDLPKAANGRLFDFPGMSSIKQNIKQAAQCISRSRKAIRESRALIENSRFLRSAAIAIFAGKRRTIAEPVEISSFRIEGLSRFAPGNLVAPEYGNDVETAEHCGLDYVVRWLALHMFHSGKLRRERIPRAMSSRSSRARVNSALLGSEDRPTHALASSPRKR